MASVPSWMREEENAGGPAPVMASSSSTTVAESPSSPPSGMGAFANANSSSDDPPYKAAVSWTFWTCELGLAFYMGLVGVYGIMSVEDEKSKKNYSTEETNAYTNTIFLGIYMVIFAAVLFFYEMSVLIPIEAIERVTRNNVGFLYNVFGRALYMIFISVVCYSITEPADLATGCGISLASVGIIEMLVYFKEPKYFGKPVTLTVKDIEE